MNTTIERPRSAKSAGRARPAVTAPSRPSVRVPELVLGVLLVAGFGLAAVLWHASASATTPVVVLADGVRRGEVVGLDDLRAAAVSGATDLRLVPWAERASVAGQVAKIDLAAGAAVARELFQDAPVLAAGEGLVGLKLGPGGSPALASGDLVDVVRVPIPDQQDTIGPADVVAERAAVWDVEVVDDSTSSVLVTLRLPVEAARQVSAAATNVRLVEVGR